METPHELVEFQDSQGIGFYLEYRLLQISEPKGLGPADLLYVICESKGSGMFKVLKKSKTQAFYHFVTGLNTSNLDSITRYIHNYIGIYTRHHRKIISATFCVFDVFSKFDLRVEMKGTQFITFIINCNRHIIKAGNIH